MSLARKPYWQRDRALLLHSRFAAMDLAVANGARKGDEVQAILDDLAHHVFQLHDPDGKVIQEHPLRLSKSTLYRELRRWEDGGRTPVAILPNYHSAGSHRPMPDELRTHIMMLASQSTGGRNKHGLAPATYARNQIHKAWREGKHIPGVGTWQDWWHTYCPGLDLPDAAPEFPWSDKTITRHVGHKAIRKTGNVSFASARDQFPRIERDYSQLRKAEVFTLDDVRLDIAAINEFTGQVVAVTAYIMMEVGSRRIVSFIVRDGAAIQSRDVDALIAAGLEVTGVGVGYTTHILFERGTVACSDQLQAILEGGTGNRVRVRRTGMIQGINWTGSAADVQKGNAAGKVVLESFNRSLHYRLLHLPGQRGNNRENSPGSLGIEKRQQIDGGLAKKRRAKRKTFGERTLTEQTEILSRFKRQAAIHGFSCDIEFPMLTVAQLEAEVQAAVEAHNSEPGHNYQGHHRHLQVETAPGVYTNLHDS